MFCYMAPFSDQLYIIFFYRYNIGYGRHDAKLPEIIDAAKAADVHQRIVNLPQGQGHVQS